MSKLRNDFTDQMVILFAIIVPSLIGSGLGGGVGFIVGLVVAIPFAIFVMRYMNGGLKSPRPRRSRRTGS